MNRFGGINIIVDETAMQALQNYPDDKHVAAVQLAVDYHRQHIARTMNGAAAADGGLFLTDIPDTDLTVLEVRLGDKCSIGLYSRVEASQMAGLILEILGAQSETHH